MWRNAREKKAANDAKLLVLGDGNPAHSPWPTSDGVSKALPGVDQPEIPRQRRVDFGERSPPPPDKIFRSEYVAALDAALQRYER